MKNYIRYENRSKEALLQAVEITPTSQGDSFVFFRSHKYANRRALSELIEKTLPDVEVMSKTTVNGENIIIARSDDTPQHLISTLQEQTSETYAPARTKKITEKVDLIRTRGVVGVIGQLLMVGSAFLDGDKKEESAKSGKNYYQSKDGKAKLWTSLFGFIGNGINTIWGVQKELDSTRLNYGKDLINKGLSLRHGENEKLLPKPAQTTRKKAAKDDPSFMDRNSIRVGSGIKLLSKYMLTTGEGKDLKLSGWLSVIGKLVSISGLPEDHFQLEKDQRPLTQLRRRSNFVSTFFDWTSTFSLLAGSFFKTVYRDKNDNNRILNKEIEADAEKIQAIKDKRKWYTLFDFGNSERRSKNNIQWWQLTASFAFVGTLLIKAIAPYTNRKIDVDNLYNHATLAVASGVQDNHVEELTQLTAQMLQTRELPEVHDQGFAKAFTDIANRLEKHHDIALHGHQNAKTVEFAEEADEKTKQKQFVMAEKPRKKQIAPKTSMTEHVVPAAETLSPSLST